MDLMQQFKIIQIREQDPLKQGLKQSADPEPEDPEAEEEGYSRARSTKTRIETTWTSFSWQMNLGFASKGGNESEGTC